MAIAKAATEPHWNYFLALDADLATLARYIEFDHRNYDCFSLELARVLMAASAECDVVAKQLAVLVDPKSKADSIDGYRDTIAPRKPSIATFEITIPRYGLTLHPWDEWSRKKGIPLWWTANNKVKHQRHLHFHLATLKNALNAVAGLFVLLLYLYETRAKDGTLVPTPNLVRVADRYIDGLDVGTMDSGVWYKL